MWMLGKTSLISGICSMLTVSSLSCGRAGSGSLAPVDVVGCSRILAFMSCLRLSEDVKQWKEAAL
jgi:hypothetical protein